jgi:hypothetical protein
MAADLVVSYPFFSVGCAMTSCYSDTFQLLGIEPRTSPAAVAEVERAEQRLGLGLPSSVREWYCYGEAIEILNRYSNQDWPIPPTKFAVTDWGGTPLLPFKYENQGVRTWAIVLDGSENPAVLVDVDSKGTQWDLHATSFPAHVHACVWDYTLVLDQPALVEAQNLELSMDAVIALREHFSERPSTFGWSGNTQYRFEGKDNAILIWSAEGRADWFVGANDEASLEIALRTVWNLDDVGRSFYDLSELGKLVINRIGF